MPFDLADMAKRAGVRRTQVIRDIKPPTTLATDLYLASYQPIIDIWEGAAERIIQQYANSLAQITTDSASDVNGQIDAAANQSQAIYLLLTTRLRDWAFRVESWHRSKWRAAVLAASRVDLGTLLGPQPVREALETTIARNAALIRNISDESRARISGYVFDGLRNRTPANEVARKIRESVGMSRARARRIASDQLAKLTSALADERRREAGIDAWEWRHSGKLNGRDEHIARDGKRYTDDPADVGDGFAKPPEDRPGQLPFCGCRSRAVLIVE
jgi:uncharacterized protein with gpF-like domain